MVDSFGKAVCMLVQEVADMLFHLGLEQRKMKQESLYWKEVRCLSDVSQTNKEKVIKNIP